MNLLAAAPYLRAQIGRLRIDPDQPVLALILAVLIVVVAAALRWRRSRAARTAPPEPPPDLGPYEVAYLAGGAQRTINAALANLVQQDVLRAEVKERTLSLTG